MTALLTWFFLKKGKYGVTRASWPQNSFITAGNSTNRSSSSFALT